MNTTSIELSEPLFPILRNNHRWDFTMFSALLRKQLCARVPAFREFHVSFIPYKSGLLALVPEASEKRESHPTGRKTTKRIVKFLEKLSENASEDDLRDTTVFNPPSVRKNRPKRSKILPAQPTRWTAQSLQDYIVTITTETFGGRYDDGPSRDYIDSLVWSLLNKSNPQTSAAMSAESLTAGVAYFSKTANTDKVAALVSEAPELFLSREVFHYWLYAHYVQQRSGKVQGFQLRSVFNVLVEMSKHNITANSETWNLVFLGVPYSHAKLQILREIQRRGIPLNEQSQASIVAYLCAKLGTQRVHDFLLGLSPDQVCLPVVHEVATKMLQTAMPNNKNVILALDFVNYWATKDNLFPTINTLNLFLYSFAKRARVDWQIGVTTYFKNEFSIDPDSRSWEHMMRAAVHLNENERKYRTIGLLAERGQKMALTPGFRAFLRSGYEKAADNGFKVVHPGQHVWKYLCDMLSWSRTHGPPNYQVDMDASKAAAILGFTDEKPKVKVRDIPMQEMGIGEMKLFANDDNENSAFPGA